MGEIRGHVQTPAVWVFVSGLGRLCISSVRLGHEAGVNSRQESFLTLSTDIPVPQTLLSQCFPVWLQTLSSEHSSANFSQRLEGGALFARVPEWLFSARRQRCCPCPPENDRKTFAPGAAFVLKI